MQLDDYKIETCKKFGFLKIISIIFGIYKNKQKRMHTLSIKLPNIYNNLFSHLITGSY